MPSQLKVLHVITSLRTGGAERLWWIYSLDYENEGW